VLLSLSPLAGRQTGFLLRRNDGLSFIIFFVPLLSVPLKSFACMHGISAWEAGRFRLFGILVVLYLFSELNAFSDMGFGLNH